MEHFSLIIALSSVDVDRNTPEQLDNLINELLMNAKESLMEEIHEYKAIKYKRRLDKEL